MVILMINLEDVFNGRPICTMTCTVLHACGCHVQFNRDASRIAFLHNASNCSAAYKLKILLAAQSIPQSALSPLT